MTARHGENSPLMTYRVTPDPAPIQVSQGSTPALATLRVTVTNHLTEPLVLEEVRFSFPVGDGPGDLTANPGSAEPQLDDSRRWRFEQHENEPGVFVLTGRRGGAMEPGDELEVRIAHIQVNPAVGTSSLLIAEQDEGESEPRLQSAQLAKVPAGFTVGDFRPAHVLVHSGRAAELTWRGESRPGATYTLLHDGPPVDVTAVRYWKSDPLHRDTSFALVVEVTEDGNTAEYAMTTLVSVARPDLSVRHLTVGGRAVLTRVTTEFSLGEGEERVCTAETDGLLVGHVQSEHDIPGSDPAPTLAVTVTVDGTDRRTSVQSRRASRAPQDPGSRLIAVVPRGATVRITRVDPVAATHQLAWMPWGNGELKE